MKANKFRRLNDRQKVERVFVHQSMKLMYEEYCEFTAKAGDTTILSFEEWKEKMHQRVAANPLVEIVEEAMRRK